VHCGCQLFDLIRWRAIAGPRGLVRLHSLPNEINRLLDALLGAGYCHHTVVGRRWFRIRDGNLSARLSLNITDDRSSLANYSSRAYSGNNNFLGLPPCPATLWLVRNWWRGAVRWCLLIRRVLLGRRCAVRIERRWGGAVRRRSSVSAVSTVSTIGLLHRTTRDIQSGA